MAALRDRTNVIRAQSRELANSNSWRSAPQAASQVPAQVVSPAYPARVERVKHDAHDARHGLDHGRAGMAASIGTPAPLPRPRSISASPGTARLSRQPIAAASLARPRLPRQHSSVPEPGSPAVHTLKRYAANLEHTLRRFEHDQGLAPCSFANQGVPGGGKMSVASPSVRFR